MVAQAKGPVNGWVVRFYGKPEALGKPQPFDLA